MEIIEELFLTLKFASKDMIVLPGDNLKGTLKYCTILATISCISKFFGIFTLKDYRGALLAVLILKIVSMKGRNKESGLPRNNGNVEHSIITDSSREKNTNSEEPIKLNTDDFGDDF